MQQITLENGMSMPSIFLGTYLTKGDETYKAVLDALDVGYRAIDSAQLYENEQQVGAAINDWISSAPPSNPRNRSDIFYTTKLAENQTYEKAMQSIRDSIKACGLGYIDLLLLHSPYGGPAARLESWRAVEDAITQGLVKAGGVSNFGLEDLLNAGIRIKPAVNQIEAHPFNTRPNLVKHCRNHGIQVQAYCPLAHGLRMDHVVITSMAEKYAHSASQIFLRWSVQNGYTPLPKTIKREHMIQNADIHGFEISEEDMAVLDGLDEQLVADWDPTNAP